jgi:hypothetical protein
MMQQLAHKETLCKGCNNRLRTRENSSSILLVCINKCNNYWISEGAEIVMILK